jgi:hypothetical protein
MFRVGPLYQHLACSAARFCQKSGYRFLAVTAAVEFAVPQNAGRNQMTAALVRSLSLRHAWKRSSQLFSKPSADLPAKQYRRKPHGGDLAFLRPRSISKRSIQWPSISFRW